LKVMLPSGDAELEGFVKSWGPKHPYNPRSDIEKG